MIFRRRQHKLPKFPPNIRQMFYSHCEDLPVEEVAAYHKEVDQALEQVLEDARENELVDVDMARQIVDRCHLLLDSYSQFGAAQRSLIVGAIRYFAHGEDALSEDHFASGFNDDARVLNFVLEELGIENYFITLR